MTPRDGPPEGSYFESPLLTGNVFAVARPTYERIGGFDRGMRGWGSEDIDFSVRAWMLGASVLHDPDSLVAHCPGAGFGLRASAAEVVGNALRSARKVTDDATWGDWLAGYRRRIPTHDFDAGWGTFATDMDSTERERAALARATPRDFRWWLDRFVPVQRRRSDGSR